MKSTKTWTVRFTARDYYMIDVEARSEAEALALARGIYSGFIMEPGKAFSLDLSEGDTADWRAEVAS